VSTTGQTGPCWRNLATSTEQLYTGRAGATHRSDWSQPKSPKTPNGSTELQTNPNSKQQQHGTTANSTKRSPKQNQTGVCTGRTGKNSTRGSTPPNPNSDLPNRSTDLRKTLGIVGTPHGESIAKLLSTKTRQIKRNGRNPTKNSSNPRTPKTLKSSPLNHGFGRGIKGKRTTKGSHIHPYQIPKSKVPKTHQEIHQERALKMTTKNE
jgi:hypothetical protein